MDLLKEQQHPHEVLDDEVEATRQAAAKRVAELLTVPEDLRNKLPKLRANLQASQLATDAQLRALVQAQLESARTGLELLHLSLARISAVQANLGAVDRLCSETQGLIGQYDLIKAVNDARTNLHYTRRQLNRTLEIPEKIHQVHELMKNEKNILRVYNEIKRLERMREGALQEARGNTEQYEVLEEVFKDVPGLFEVFEEKLYDLTRQAITLAKERPSVLVKVLQIIEREHKLWEARSAEKQKKKKSKKNKRKNDIDPRDKVKEHIRISVGERFRQVFAECGEDVQKIISQSAKLSDDLNVVVQQEYHQRLKAMFSEFAQQADDLSTQEVLVLVEWVHKTYEPQMKALGAKEVADSLMDALEPLMLSYKTDIAKIMEEWTSRLIDQDKRAEPDQLDGLFYTDAPVLLFKFINQQIDVVRPTACPRAWFSKNALKCLENINKLSFIPFEVLFEYAVVVSAKYTKRFVLGEVDSLYMENILAMINNSHKCHDYLQDLSRKMSKTLDSEHVSKLDFNKVAITFFNIAEEAIKTVVAIIFKDLEPALIKIFTKDWYEEDLIEAIVETVKDYYDNECIKGHIVDSALRKMIILDQLVYRYVAEMISRKLVFETRTGKRMQDDEQALHDFFVKEGGMSDKQVTSMLQALFDLRQIVECEPASLVENFAELMKHYPDISMDTISSLLARRTDLAKPQSKDVLEACGTLHQQKQVEEGQEPASAVSDASGAAPQEDVSNLMTGKGMLARIQEAQASGVTSFAKAFSLVSNVNIKSKK